MTILPNHPQCLHATLSSHLGEAFFTELEQKNFHLQVEMLKDYTLIKTMLRRRTELEESGSDHTLYYKATVIKEKWYQYKTHAPWNIVVCF